jgi:tRNA-dihydrouridine synthase A
LKNSHPIISVAPMMNCTDRHERYFLRLIAPNVRLYTEMITTQALIHGDLNYLLSFHPQEKYLALQLGGSCPQALSHCAKLGEDFGYDEINLNIGCPSKRVCAGRFGASLMLDPTLVGECVAAMVAKVSIPVTVKCRIGVDQQNSYQALCHFIETVASSGCDHFIIHARCALLSGLSPKENREIPPLRYEMVRQIKQDFPHLTIILNGGIKEIADIDQHLPYVDGVMIGRAAYAGPYLLSEIQSKYFNQSHPRTRFEIMQFFIPYVTEQLQNKVKLSAMTRHVLGLFQGQMGASHWRRYLSQHAHLPQSGVDVIEKALALVGNEQERNSKLT